MSIFKLACPDHPDVKVSANPECASEIITGEHAGTKLNTYIDEKGKDVLGLDARDFDHFPYMVTWKTYQKAEVFNPNKAKLWVVVTAAPGGKIYLGAKNPLDENWNNREDLVDDLNPVTPYDQEAFFLQPGLIAAVGSGITLLNVEQESNVTRSVVHLEPVAVDCKISGPYLEDGASQSSELCICDQFDVTKTRVDGRVEFDCSDASFATLIMVEGNGLVEHDDTTLHMEPGNAAFIEAKTYDVKVTGNCTYILIRV